MAADFQLYGELILQSVNTDAAFRNLQDKLNKLPTQRVDALTQNLSSAAASADKLSKSQDKAAVTGKRVAKSLKETANAAQDFGDKAGLALRRFTAFTIAATGVFGSLRAIKNSISDAIAFNRELVKVAQVTGRTVDSLSGLRSEITNLSKEFGTSSTDLASVSKTLSQAGLSARETQVALKSLAQTTLAPTFTNITKTTEGAIASLRQFNLQAEDLGNTFGIINAVAAKFAVESDDIVTGIRKSGAAFSAANQGIKSGNASLAEFVALFSSVRATTRESADTIGTGLRTIFTRIQRPKTIEFLRQFGIELTDLNGKFVGPYEAIQRLGNALRNLNARDTRFATIVEQIGGFRQVSKVIPLLQQTALQTDILGVALKGQASLAEDAATAQQDLGVQITKLREQFAALFRDIVNTDSFQALAKSTVSLASGLLQIADAAKEALPLLTLIASVKGLGFAAGSLGSFGARVTTGRALLPIRRQGGGGTAGSLVPGPPAGDIVPAYLEGGEYVFNKNAVNAIGKENLDKINELFPRHGGVQFAKTGGSIAKFQTGGSVSSVTGRFTRFSGNAEFRGGTEIAISALREFGFNVEQVVDILNRATDGAKGPGEALGKIFGQLEKHATDYDRRLVRLQQESNKESRLVQQGFGIKTGLSTNDPLATSSIIVAPAGNFSGLNKNRAPAILQTISATTDDIPQNLGALGRTRISGVRTGGSGRVSSRRKIVPNVNLSQIDAVLQDNIFRQLNEGRGSFFNRRPGDIRGLTRTDFNLGLSEPFGLSHTRTLTEKDILRNQRIARTGGPNDPGPRNRLLRDGEPTSFANLRRNRIGGRGLLLGGAGLLAAGVDNNSAAGRAIQSGFFTGASASFLGLGPYGAVAAGGLAGANTFLRERSQEQLNTAFKNLESSTDNLRKTFEGFGEYIDSNEQKILGNRSSDFLSSLSITRSSLANADNAGLGALAAGSPGIFRTGDPTVNQNIRAARGTSSFFASRLTDAGLGALDILSLGQLRDEPFPFTNTTINSTRKAISASDQEALRKADLERASLLAEKAAPGAQVNRDAILALLKQGTRIQNIDEDTLIASVSDRINVQRAQNRDFSLREGRAQAEKLKESLNKEVDLRDKLINSLSGFSDEIQVILNRLDKSVAILDFGSANNKIFSSNIQSLATGSSLNFQRASRFKNASALSGAQLRRSAFELQQEIGGNISNDIINRAVSLPDIKNQIRNLELKQNIGAGGAESLDNLKKEKEAAEKAADALSRLEEATNDSISGLRQELSVRRGLVRESNQLALSAISASGNFAERKLGLIGQGNRFVGRGAVLQAQVQSLTGGATSVNDILANIQTLQQRRAGLAGSNLDQRQKAIEDSRLLENLDRNTEALKILASDISDLTDVQNKLTEIQRQREVGSNLLQDTFGLNQDQARERFKQLAAFGIFQQTGGDLKAVAKAGFTNQDVAAGFGVRQQFALDEQQRANEATQFNRNIARSFGINNQRDLVDRFGLENAKKLDAALTNRPVIDAQGNAVGGTARERDLLQQADEIGKRQVDAIRAQKQIVDQTIANFNTNVIQSIGQNVRSLQEAAKALSSDITVEFKPINVNIDLGQDLQSFKNSVQNEIFDRVKNEIATAIDGLKNG